MNDGTGESSSSFSGPGQRARRRAGVRTPAGVGHDRDRRLPEDLEELESRGVEFVTEVLELVWGYAAQSLDPDGNGLQIRKGR
jgi:hypothetical protein